MISFENWHIILLDNPSVLQKQQRALPHLTEPHDSLRLGVQTLKDKASVNHPVEAIEEQVAYLFLFIGTNVASRLPCAELCEAWCLQDTLLCMK